MAHSDFIKLLNKNYNISSPAELNRTRRGYYDFAASTNSRALQFIDELAVLKKINWANCKVLDIGCAYGGFVIETAKKGAESYGIDIVAENHELAQANAKGMPIDAQFSLLDATTKRFLDVFNGKKFNVIILNDVFEHIYDTATLLNNIANVSAKNCILYFVIPNGQSINHVMNEGHYGTPGVSLLPPSKWHHFMTNSFDVYYRPLAYYLALFKYSGFSKILFTNHPDNDRNDYQSLFQSKLVQLKSHINEFLLSSGACEHDSKLINEKLESYNAVFLNDLETLSYAEFCYKFDTDFWRGMAVFNKKDRVIYRHHDVKKGLLFYPKKLKRLLSWKISRLR